MSDDFNWDEFGSPSDFMAFKEIGDAIAGEVLAVRKGKDFNGGPCPELVIRTDDGDVTVTAGQTVLQSCLAEVRPRTGEKVAITYSGVGDAKPGKAPAKLFTVAVRDAAGQLRTAPQASAPAPAATPAPAPAAATSLI
jgi:hypothetical protein